MAREIIFEQSGIDLDLGVFVEEIYIGRFEKITALIFPAGPGGAPINVDLKLKMSGIFRDYDMTNAVVVDTLFLTPVDDQFGVLQVTITKGATKPGGDVDLVLWGWRP